VREFFTPLRLASVAGLILLLGLWVFSMIGLMANTKVGIYLRYGESVIGSSRARR
jgi:hypothetical protein